MAYSSGVFFIDYENGSDAARSALTSCIASNPSGTTTRINKVTHGLVTGAVVDLTLFSAWLNGAWKITVVDADNFDLDGAVWQATADNNGTVTPRGGSSKIDAWKTVNSGATNTRVQSGDICRVMASPAATNMGQDATWTYQSQNVVLTTPVTVNIDLCETAWTAAPNVTCTATSTLRKQGSFAAQHSIASGFTTGLVAYKSFTAMDLSAYEQISLHWRSGLAIGSGVFEIRLCSDSAGVTAVDTFSVPALGATSTWHQLLLDKGAPLGSSIQSIAIYALSDPGGTIITVDNIIAVKAKSAPDSLSLQSLIGKPSCQYWQASTAYAANTRRKPTPPNRNGLRYKVIAGGGGNSGATEPVWPDYYGGTVVDGDLTWQADGPEDTWLAIRSINGTTIELENEPTTFASETYDKGYGRETETAAILKREPTHVGYYASGANLFDCDLLSGVSFVGGFDRSSMSTQSDETWFATQNGNGDAIYSYLDKDIKYSNFGFAKMQTGFTFLGSTDSGFVLKDIHFISIPKSIFYSNTNYDAVSNSNFYGVLAENCRMSSAACMHFGSSVGVSLRNVAAISCVESSAGSGRAAFQLGTDFAASGLYCINSSTGAVESKSCCNIYDFVVTDTYAAIMPEGGNYKMQIHNYVESGVSKFIMLGTGVSLSNDPISISKINGDSSVVGLYFRDETSSVTLTGSSQILRTTDRRHTASGYSWRFNNRNFLRPEISALKMPLGKIPLNATASTIKIWCNRNSTDLVGKLVLLAGNHAGVYDNVSVMCEPSVDTWVEYTLNVTPSEAGVLELEFHVWGTAGAGNYFWIDDLTVTT